MSDIDPSFNNVIPFSIWIYDLYPMDNWQITLIIHVITYLVQIKAFLYDQYDRK